MLRLTCPLTGGIPTTSIVCPEHLSTTEKTYQVPLLFSTSPLSFLESEHLEEAVLMLARVPMEVDLQEVVASEPGLY